VVAGAEIRLNVFLSETHMLLVSAKAIVGITPGFSVQLGGFARLALDY
jgi:hypothetical protein